MTRATWNRMTLAAVVLPLIGVAFSAVSVFLFGASDRGGAIIAYAIGVMPLAAMLGAAGFYLAGQAQKAPWTLGALAALAGAVLAAIVAATVRFRQAGATGFVSVSALPYTAEFLMLAGVVPAILVLGAGVAGRQAVRGTLAVVAWSLAAGAVSSASVGLTLIAVRGLGSLPFLNPVVVWIGLAVGIGGFGWRRIDAAP